MSSTVPLLERQEITPLRGDGNGIYKIHVIGNSGSGKSTLSRHISKVLNLPYIPLDEVFWNPNWNAPSNEEFQSRVAEVLEKHRETGWVIDGNYSRRMGEVVKHERTDCIWLDPPLILYLPRIIFRTFRRLVGLEPNCAPGCYESLRDVLRLSDKSIIWWCVTHHDYCRKFGEKLVAEQGAVEDGGKVRRIGGWGGELKRWIADVERMAERERAT
ncbi:hypothetical protein TWF281_003548 [Arthrobotrys megalospora]